MNREIIDQALAGGEPDSGGWLAGRVAWGGTCAVLCLLALLVALPGVGSVPPDSHEVFVVQSVREMSARGDWLVPWFNGEPRLNKPPLSYWATGLVAALDGALPEATITHARLVSVGAGLGILALTLWLGARLYGRRTAVVAGTILVGSAGFFSFTHDARPDLLYALCTSAALVAGIEALRGEPGRRLPACLMWVGFSLATLAKGPHMPALALGGLWLHAALSTREPRASWARLRPQVGLVIVGFPALAWWGWLRWQLPSGELGHSQLAGSLLTPDWSRIGTYYLFRPLQLLLPWLPLVALACAGLGLRTARRDTGWLWWPLLLAVAGLSLGRQFRYFYLLPLIVPLVLGVARPVVVLLGTPLGPWRRQLVQLVLVLQALLVLACAGWVLVASGRIAYLTPPIIGFCAAVTGAGLAWRWLSRRDEAAPLMRSVAAIVASGVFLACTWPGAAITGVAWSGERFEAAALAAAAAREALDGRRLATLGVSPTLYVHAANARVLALADGATAASLAAEGPLALVVRSDRLPELAPGLRVIEVARARRGGRDDVLVRLEYPLP